MSANGFTCLSSSEGVSATLVAGNRPACDQAQNRTQAPKPNKIDYCTQPRLVVDRSRTLIRCTDCWQKAAVLEAVKLAAAAGPDPPCGGRTVGKTVGKRSSHETWGASAGASSRQAPNSVYATGARRHSFATGGAWRLNWKGEFGFRAGQQGIATSLDGRMGGNGIETRCWGRCRQPDSGQGLVFHAGAYVTGPRAVVIHSRRRVKDEA